MSRYRLLPTPAQEVVVKRHCAHARYVWNLAVEQYSHWRPGRASAPGWPAQCRQLTEARAEYPWLAAGSHMVQQQALRDFAQAMAAFLDPANPAGRPSWRKAGRNEGFRIVGRGRQWDVRRVSRHTGRVWVPKVGWVRFRWSRDVPEGVRSYIPQSGWGLLVRRLEDKAPGRVEKDQTAFHEPALLGMRARGSEVAREPSRLPVHCLQFRRPRGCERGN